MSEILIPWFVVFSDSEWLRAEPEGRVERAVHWGMGRLKPGFRHVFAMRPAESFEGWIVVNPGINGLFVFDLPAGRGVRDSGGLTGDQYLALLCRLEAQGLARILVHVAGRTPALRLQPWYSCVSVVRQLLGLPGGVKNCCKNATPWRLYRELEGLRAAAGKEESAMGDILGGNDAAEKEQKRLEKERKELEERNLAKLRAARSGRTGRDLLTFQGSLAGPAPAAAAASGGGGKGASKTLGG